MSPSGGKQTRLAANKNYGRETPSYSPDGRRLAYTDQDGIYIASASGKHVRRISHGLGDRDPSFSGPKGRRIAFSSQRAGAGPQIWVMGAGGGHPKRLTRGEFDLQPAFSPDGKHIAYISSSLGEFKGELRIMDDKGKHNRDLGGSLRCESASFAPDGKSVLAGCSTAFGFVQAWSFGLNGKATRVSHPGDNFDDPTYSPDGKLIAFSRLQDLFVMHADGTGANRIARGRFISEPDWQPR